MAKSPKAAKKNLIVEKKFRRNLIAISAVALFIKILIILNIQGFDWYEAGEGNLGNGLGELLDNNYAPPNAWYLADGDNYIRALQGLVTDGFFSKEEKLLYWPAGYSLLIWPIIQVFQGYFFLALSLIQSLLYAAATFWFVEVIRKTRISRVSYGLAILLAFNPTLSLNTISVGYELPVVSMSLIAAAALLHYFLKERNGLLNWETFISAVAFAVAVFMQPRLLIIAFIFFALWALAKFKAKLVPAFLILTMGLVSFSPGILIFRNYAVHGYATISTNLGNTMRLGAGPNTSGGYSPQPVGIVDCPDTKTDVVEADKELVNCVIDWYIANPAKSLVLFWNKARFFWSPWFGPEYNGTMARNPWFQNHPLKSSTQTTEGFNLIFGGIGKFTSWIWMLGGIFLLVYGFLYLWRLGDLERLLALIAGLSFLLNLVSAMLTVGDNRFRIPTMAMSLLLQSVGCLKIFLRRSVISPNPKIYIPWPTLRRIVSKGTKP